jgi:hypothetical protein
MKKIIGALLFATALSMAGVFAQGGTTGPLTWVLEDGTLTISGEGEMPDYDEYMGTIPWYNYREFIKTIRIESGVTCIGAQAFLRCHKLTSISIPHSVTIIGNLAFAFCTDLILITLPNGLTSIRSGAFSTCTALTSINIPNSVASINNDAFAYCISLTSIVIPSSVISIEGGTFANCTNLTSITIPNSITTIGYSAFSRCSSLTSITIPNSVTSIGNTAFGWCTSLTSITIPNNVTTIENFAFYWCVGLTSITNLNSIPISINPNVFEGMNQSECILEVPMGSVSAYKNAEVWKEFNIVGIEVGIEPIEADVVKIYPNPTSGELRITNRGPDKGKLSEANYELRYPISDIEIYDVSGKKLLSHYLITSSSNHLINISHLPAGIYVVKITTETGVITRKIVKN